MCFFWVYYCLILRQRNDDLQPPQSLFFHKEPLLNTAYAMKMAIGRGQMKGYGIATSTARNMKNWRK